MAEEYRKFDASDYMRTDEDLQGLLSAALDEDVWGRRGDSRCPEARRSDTQPERSRSRNRPKSGKSLPGALQRRQTPPWQRSSKSPAPWA